MSIDLQELKNTMKYESLLVDLLEPKISHQESRILAILFRNGGYITLNSLVEKLDIAQPTVSNLVSYLVEKNYIRKNPEVIPKALVLLLDVNSLKDNFYSIQEAEKYAIKFLTKISSIQDLDKLQNLILKAFRRIFPNNKYLSDLLSNIYLNPLISRDELFRFVLNGNNSPKDEKFLENLINTNKEYIQTVYKKYRKNEMYFAPVLSLNSLAEVRLTYLNVKNNQFDNQLSELDYLMRREYHAILPHQLLRYPSDIQNRIDINLKYFKEIHVINNQIYQIKDKKVDIVDLIINCKNFTKTHIIQVITQNDDFSKDLRENNLKIKVNQKKIPNDYQKRDLIIFSTFGCIVIPENLGNLPYYDISPPLINTVNEIFHSVWNN